MRTGLLYKITRDDTANFQPLYLFGTMHDKNSEISYLSKETVKAYETSNTIAIESSHDAVVTEKAVEALTEEWNKIFEHGITIEQAKTVNDIVFRIKYIRNILDIEYLQNIPPLFILVLLHYILLPPHPEKLIDFAFVKGAIYQNRQTHALLDIKREQLYYLMGMHLNLQDQLDLFDHLITPFKQNPTAAIAKRNLDIKKMRSYYLKGDIGQFLAYYQAQSKPTEAQIRYHHGTVTERDALMVSAIEKNFAHGNAFIAVGALHLSGIKALLAEKGYRVEAVEEGPRFIHASALKKPVNINTAILKFNKRYAIIATALVLISAAVLIAGVVTGGLGLLIGGAAVFGAGLIAATIFAKKCFSLKTALQRIDSKKMIKQTETPHPDDKPALTLVRDENAPKNHTTLAFGVIESRVNQSKQTHLPLPNIDVTATRQITVPSQ